MTTRPEHGLRGALRGSTRFLTPGWLVVHVVVLAAAISMVLLGRWQLHVSNAKHFDLQNFSYVVQWWLFAAFALLLWARLLRDALRPPKDDLAPGGQVALRTGPGSGLGPAYVGPAEMVATRDGPGLEPVVYRGYVIPQSAQSPHRSEGDDYHESYNDYLWQLSLYDGTVENRAQSSAAGDRAPGVEQADVHRVIDAAPVDEAR